MIYHTNHQNSGKSNWVLKTVGAVAIGGAAWYLWMNSPIKARMDTTLEQAIEISERFRRELFDYHLEFYTLSRQYLLMREAQGRPLHQQVHQTTTEISTYLEQSSIAIEYAKKRLEIIKSIQPNLNINQFIKKSTALIQEYIKITGNGDVPSDSLARFHFGFFFESVFIDGQAIALGYLTVYDKPESLNHRNSLRFFCDYAFESLDLLKKFYEDNRNNPSPLDKKNKLKKLHRKISRMETMKERLTEFIGEEQCRALREDIRLYVLKLSYEVTRDLEDKYDINHVHQFNNSFGTLCYTMVDSIMKKENSDYFFGIELTKIQVLKNAYNKFQFGQEGEEQVTAQ